METSRENAIENLRAELLAYIKSNEKVYVKYKKIIVLLTVVIAILIFAVIGIGVSSVVIVKTMSDKTDVAMSRLEKANVTNILERTLNQSERKDIASARAQLAPFVKMVDSLQKVNNRKIDRDYKKSIK